MNLTLSGDVMPEAKMPSRAAAAEAAADIAAAKPPQTGRAMPRANWVTILRRAGWPFTLVTVDLPQGAGRTSAPPQPVATVPESWLRELASRLRVPWPDACRGVVEG